MRLSQPLLLVDAKVSLGSMIGFIALGARCTREQTDKVQWEFRYSNIRNRLSFTLYTPS